MVATDRKADTPPHPSPAYPVRPGPSRDHDPVGTRAAKEQRGFRIRSQPDHHWRPSQPGPGLRSRGDRRVARLPRRRSRRAGPRARPLPHAPPDRAGPREARGRARDAQHGLRQHHRHQGRAVLPRQRGDRAQDPQRDPLERRRHGLARAAPGDRRRRPHRHVRVLGVPVRRGLQPLLRGKDGGDGGDQIFFQGHASPGIYARAFLLDRLSEQHLDGFRQERSRRLPTACPRIRIRG